MVSTVQDIDAGQGIPISGGLGGYREVFKDVNLGVHATGGVSLIPDQFGLDVGSAFTFFTAQSTGGYVFSYDYTNKKLIAYKDSGGASVMVDAGAVDLSALTIRCMAIGTKVN